MIEIDKLQKKYSRVLSKTVYPETAEGWDGLVEDFIEEFNEASKDFREGCAIIEQIKEKFGGMRIYVDYQLPVEQIFLFEQIVSKYEHLSLKTCTICGTQDNKMHKRDGYWDIVICEECFNKR